MKKVVQQAEDQVSIKKVHVEKYYGVTPNKTTKGFIVREQYERGNYYAISMYRLTKGNRFHESMQSLPELIQTLVGYGFEVYEFDNTSELFTWLAE